MTARFYFYEEKEKSVVMTMRGITLGLISPKACPKKIITLQLEMFLQLQLHALANNKLAHTQSTNASFV